jgi:hypothetical protein
MAWFDRHLGAEDPRAAWERLGKLVDAAGLPAAVDAASGPRGLRRYVVRFEVRGGAPRVVGLEGETLRGGGGPPTPAAFDANAAGVQSALATLRARLGPWAFDRGAMGVVRHASGELELTFRFDEDAEELKLADLPQPEGQGTPTEDPAYLRALAAWESRITVVRGRWTVARATDTWSLAEGRLTLTNDAGVRTQRAEPIATWSAENGLFTWLLAKPVADEAPFVEPELTLEIGGAMELAVFAAARMGCSGLFQGEIEGGGATLFAGTRE